MILLIFFCKTCYPPQNPSLKKSTRSLRLLRQQQRDDDTVVAHPTTPGKVTNINLMLKYYNLFDTL